MFEQKKRETAYDPVRQIPVIHASICNGEQVFGLEDKETGKFTEIMAIHSDRELYRLLKQWGIDREDVKKKW